MHNKIWVVSFMDFDDEYDMDVFTNAEAAALAYVALREDGYDQVDLHHVPVFDKFEVPDYPEESEA